MSWSPLVSYFKISPHKRSHRNHKIDTVAVHCMAAPLSIESCGNVFQGNRVASSNYGIGPDGRIGCYVEEEDRSFCTSSSAVDERAITIEVATEKTHPYKCTDAAYKSLINLLVDVCKRNGIKQLLWKGDKSLSGQVDKQNMEVHRFHANKACPGDYLYNLHPQIAKEVNERLNDPDTEKYGVKLEKKKYEVLKTCYLRSKPGLGDATKVKFKTLDDTTKSKCVKDSDGFAKWVAGKRFDRIRKYTGSAGNTWLQTAKGYWLPAKLGGEKRVKEIKE